MTLRDPEVLDLLADDPTLLAVADAVVATQQAPRRPLFRRTGPRVAVVAVVAAAAIIVALVLPQGKHGIVDRAIAAIGDGRVMHIVSEMPTGTVDVDLQSGRRIVQQARVEFWGDQQLKRFHVRMTVNGQVWFDLLWPQDKKTGFTRVETVDPAFAALWTGYREALEDGTATLAGEGDAFGHHVYWLRFSPTEAKSPGTEVAVDTETYKPVVLREHYGARTIDQRILLAESSDFSAADFTRDGPGANPSLEAGSSSVGVTSMGLEESGPNTTVPSGWLTAGPEADGHQLAAVVPQTITTSDKKTIHGIQLVYGDLDHGFAARNATTIDELSTPDDPQSWAHIPPGTVRIQEGQTGDSNGNNHAQWSGYLVKNDRYVTIRTQHGEQALIAIARSLRPVP